MRHRTSTSAHFPLTAQNDLMESRPVAAIELILLVCHLCIAFGHWLWRAADRLWRSYLSIGRRPTVRRFGYGFVPSAAKLRPQTIPNPVPNLFPHSSRVDELTRFEC
jgi:hypothetical protein